MNRNGKARTSPNSVFVVCSDDAHVNDFDIG